MEFGLFFFASRGEEFTYDGVMKAAEFADRSGFKFVSVPERHFSKFGAPFPNPAILASAVAARTSRVQIRAGSLILPLHHPIRAVEDWSMVEVLSSGRLALSFGSGWNVNDFILSPSSYENRRRELITGIEIFQKMWRERTARSRNGLDEEAKVEIYPKPGKDEVPIWLTSSGNIDTFLTAGRAGYNVLTHLENQGLEELERKITLYRRARQDAGATTRGLITVMLHTFVSEDLVDLKAAKMYLRAYLMDAMDLEAANVVSGGKMSGEKIGPDNFESDRDIRKAVLDRAESKYLGELSLIGRSESVARRVSQLEEIDVDEVACLIDFVPDEALMVKSLQGLAGLQEQFSERFRTLSRHTAAASFLAPLE